jgi:hypothetical protein
MKALTFYLEKSRVEVEVVRKMAVPGFFKVRYDDTELARKREQLIPLDEETKRFLDGK